MTLPTAQRLPGPFGPAIDLLPKEQRIEKVRHDEPVGNAIERMSDNEYSQLPVERDGEIIGLFSWRSFARAVGLKSAAAPSPDLRVEACLARVIFVSPHDFIDTTIDWTEQDCVLVGSPREMLGLLAIYDVLGRLQDFSEAFCLIHETEHLLRTMLTEAVGEERLAEMLATMTLRKGQTQQPRTLEDCVFTQYGDLVCSNRRWPEFEPMFYCDRASMNDTIEDITKVRNVVFHFKRPVTTDDVDRLRRFRTRLLQQREAFHRRRRG
jgi:CBS domain-containing protein